MDSHACDLLRSRYFISMVLLLLYFMAYSCVATEDQRFFLIAATNEGLLRFTVNDKECIVRNEQPMLTRKGSYAVATHISKNLIFWTEDRKIFHENTGYQTEGYRIKCAKIAFNNGTLTNETIVLDNTGLVSVVKVDWIYNHLYWVDSQGHAIKVSTLEGQMLTTIYRNISEEITDIALDPREGLIYVAFVKPLPRISCIGMDGHKQKVLVTKPNFIPMKISLDFKDHRLYWIDKSSLSIQSVGMDGTDVRRDLYSPSSLNYRRSFFALSLVTDFVVWSDETTQKLNWICKDSKQFHQLTIEVDFTGHVSLNEDSQPQGCNYCTATKGINCSYLCLPSTRDNFWRTPFRCRCPDNKDSSCIAKELTSGHESLSRCQQVRGGASENCLYPACSDVGDFGSLQCDVLHGVDTCWCSDKSGVMIPETIMTSPNVPDCSQGSNLKLCVAQLVQYRRGTTNIHYEPTCTPDGYFMDVQCSKDECWCVDDNGRVKEDTAVKRPQLPICNESFKVHFVVIIVIASFIIVSGILGFIKYRLKLKESIYTEFLHVQNQLYSDYEAQYEDVSDLDLPSPSSFQVSNAEYEIPHTLHRTSEAGKRIAEDSSGYLQPRNYLNGAMFWQKVLANANQSEVRRILDHKRKSAAVKHNDCGYAIPNKGKRKTNVASSETADIYAEPTAATSQVTISSTQLKEQEGD